MADRPIIFSADSVRAILDGRKTQTRRVVKLREFQQSETRGYDYTFRDRRLLWNDYRADELLASKRVPFHAGDRLWVKEGFAFDPDWAGPGVVHYRATHQEGEMVQGGRWRSPLYMPRWAYRLTLEVLSVRVERVQSITEDDARAEGCESDADAMRCLDHLRGSDAARALPSRLRSASDEFRDRWDAINRERAPWASNPWVWVIEFRRVES